MADAAVNFGANDIFGLGGSFVAQTATNNDNDRYAEMRKADGDNSRESGAFDGRDDATATYKFSADVGLGAALPDIGSVSNGYVIETVSIEMSNEDFPTINITGHKHDVNSHVDGTLPEYSIPAGTAALITGAFGVYDLGANAGATTACQSGTYEITAEHIDVLDCDGDHFAGTGFHGMETLNMTYVSSAGNVTGFTKAGADPDWVTDSVEETESNETFDTVTVTGHRYVTRNP